MIFTMYIHSTISYVFLIIHASPSSACVCVLQGGYRHVDTASQYGVQYEVISSPFIRAIACFPIISQYYYYDYYYYISYFACKHQKDHNLFSTSTYIYRHINIILLVIHG